MINGNFAKQYSNFDEMLEFRKKVLKNYGREPGFVKKNDWEGLFKSGLTEKDKSIVKKKINLAKRNLHRILITKFCRRIAISGSIAVGCPKEEDDIDIFVIVRDNTLWIYRFYIKLFGGKMVAKRFDKEHKNKFCVNFIVEESTLKEIFEDSVVFQHEWMSLINLYYFNKNNFAYDNQKKVNFFIVLINNLAYFLQKSFSLICGNKISENKHYFKQKFRF